MLLGNVHVDVTILSGGSDGGGRGDGRGGVSGGGGDSGGGGGDGGGGGGCRVVGFVRRLSGVKIGNFFKGFCKRV